MTCHVEYLLNGTRILHTNHPCRAVQKVKGTPIEYTDRLSEVTCKLCRAWIEARPSVWNTLRKNDLDAGTAQPLEVLAADARKRHLEKLERAKAAKVRREKKKEERRIARNAARAFA